MQNVIAKFNTVDDLDTIADVKDTKETLIQIFLGRTDKELIQQIQEFFQKKFPKAVLIGATTDGTINKKEYYDNESVVSITSFEKTILKESFIGHELFGDSYDSGKKIASKIIQQDTKVIISLADGINTNGEDYVKGISSVNNNVILSGGLAGDNAQMKKTYVFNKYEITSSGAVAVSLNSSDLEVETMYNFDWTPIGKELHVNKAVKNRIYEINGMSTVDIYAKYLGKEVAKQLPKTGIEFPLIYDKDGVEIGRAVLTKFDDGSMTFAGNIKEGTKVRFGVGNANIIIKDINNNINSRVKKLKYKPEAVFVYSCMARKSFLQNYLGLELEILNGVGPVSGFFTYGEFFQINKKNELFNGTMTLLALSENKEPIEKKESYTLPKKLNQNIGTIHALANLANVVSRELEELNKNLEKRVKKSADYIYKQAYYDKLTNLPNRLSLINRLSELEDGILFLINIDDFTSINDFYGYIVGDKILKKVAEVLNEYAKKKNAQLYKLPADEFALIFNREYDYTWIEEKIKRLLKYIEESEFIIDDMDIYISVAVSSSHIKKDGNCLENADMSLKKAKTENVAYMIYNDDMQELKRYENNLKMANILKKASINESFTPFFQPIYDIKTSEVFEYETLARLELEDGTYLSPAKFLELSQKIKLYHRITEIMIEKSFKKFSKTSKNFSINLAFEDMLNKKTTDFIFSKMKEYDIGPELTIEILETQEMVEDKNVVDFLEQMKNLGASIAIDDFGSGFANFEYISKIESDFIKIDGSLIKNIDKEEDTKIVVETIVEFAKKLGKKTIAEYVHSRDIYDIVKKLGVDYAQGYYLGKPNPEI